MTHVIIELGIGLLLWKYIPDAVGLRDKGIERAIKIIMKIVGIIMVIGGAISLITWIL